MLVQRISVITACSVLLVACGTNNVTTPTNTIPVGNPLNTPTHTPKRYITQQQSKYSAQQYALKQKREQAATQQRQKWEQEHARKQREAEQRFAEEKKRIARMKYHQKYKAEQERIAQQKLEAEKLRLVKLQYQRKFEAEQQRKKYEQQAKIAEQKHSTKVAQQQRLAAQRRAEYQQKHAKAEQEKQKLAQARAKYQQQYQQRLAQQQQYQAQARTKQQYQAQARARQQQQVLARQQQQRPQAQRVAQRSPVQHINIQAPGHAMYRGPGRYNRLPDTVARSLRLRGVSERGMSAYVRPVSGGPAVLTAGADKARNPASTMKLVTTYAALGTLGGNYRWPTEIYTSGRIVRGTLQGDVIIKGYGDPDFKESDLTQLLQGLRRRGINNIAGNLVADNNYFNIPYQNPGAFDGKSKAAYNAQPEALLYQGRGSTYKFKNLSKRVKRSSRRMPRTAGARADLNTNLFGAFWKVWVGKLGGGMQGRFKRGRTPPNAQLVHRHHSKPLRQVLQTINKKSNNVMARQVMLSVGARSLGAPGTPRKGATAISNFMQSRGLNFPELRIENGSGLSRVSRISARNLGEMLVNAYNSPWRNDYMNSLAVLGVDGTLRNRMRKSGIAGRGRFKTGTLRNVRGLAGYVQASNGQTYVVSILHNDSKARSKARNAHDELVKWVYWGPRSNFASAQ